MTTKAVIDRFEGQQAVLLVDGQTVVVPRFDLPDKAKEGDWLQVELDGERLLRASIDSEETGKAEERIREKLERLRRGEHKR